MLEDVSACIIAKNEESNLPRLLESIKGKFFEIVLVDTGSTDKTIEIAKDYGCKVFQTEWTGFADARNFAVDKASGKWIWHFDADTELEEDEYEKFKTFYYLNLKDSPIFEGMNVVYKNFGPDGRVKALSSTVHIHKKLENIRWVGKVHERVINLDTQNITVPSFVVKVIHYGYSSISVQRDKAIRNIKLIFDEMRKEKNKQSVDYIANLFYAIQSYLTLFSIEGKEKDLRRSIKYINKFKEALKLPQIDKKSIFVKHFYVYSSSIYKGLDQPETALKLIEEGLQEDPNYPDLIYSKAEILELIQDLKESTNWYLKFLYSIDKLKLENQSIISDNISKGSYIALTKLPDIILTYKPELIEELTNFWKKEKGFYTGILIYSIKIKQDNINEAEKILIKLSKMYEQEDIIFTLLGKFYKDKNITKAIDYMKKALILNSLNPEANIFFAQIFDLKGDYQNALKFYFRYLDLVQDNIVKQRVSEIIKILNKTP